MTTRELQRSVIRTMGRAPAAESVDSVSRALRRPSAALVCLISGALCLFGCSDDDEPGPASGWSPDAGGLTTIDSGVSAMPGGAAGGTGSVAGTGGAAGTGGVAAGMGGAAGTGGATGMGGAAGTGGVAGMGGAAGTGGSAGLGGSTGAAAGTGAAGGARDGGVDAGPGGGTGGDAGPAHMDQGQGDGKDVITIGDSYMNLFFSGIEISLETISGRDYRNYAFPGTLMLNEQIPDQYKAAKGEDPDIKTVVMTGGGNDILTTSCSGECKDIVDRVSARMDQMMKEMGMDGVQDVILVSYGYPSDQSRRGSLDYSRMLLPTKCTKNSMPRCHFIDPVQQLMGKISSDGIHPTGEGYDILGKLVWDLMKAEGIRR